MKKYDVFGLFFTVVGVVLLVYSLFIINYLFSASYDLVLSPDNYISAINSATIFAIRALLLGIIVLISTIFLSKGLGFFKMSKIKSLNDE